MPESIDIVLRMVEEGRLTAEEAASILAALDASADAPTHAAPDPGPAEPRSSGAAAGERGRWVKVEVTDGGRTVVNVKLPASLGELAMGRIPGLADEEMLRIREALRTGLRGDILRVMDEKGSGVRIAVE